VTGAALVGWCLAAVLAVRAVRTARRLELIADAEHELRGSLTAFGLALEGLRGAPTGRRTVRALQSELERSRAALADLEEARAGAAARPRVEHVALDRLASSAASAWRPAARRLGRRLELDWRAGPVRVRADRGRLAQALGNLMANAVEHGAGPVRVVAQRRGDAVRVEVVNAVRRDGGGAASSVPGRTRGRGLAIASRAVEHCGGDLTLDAGPDAARAAIELPLVP